MAATPPPEAARALERDIARARRRRWRLLRSLAHARRARACAQLAGGRAHAAKNADAQAAADAPPAVAARRPGAAGAALRRAAGKIAAECGVVCKAWAAAQAAARPRALWKRSWCSSTRRSPRVDAPKVRLEGAVQHAGEEGCGGGRGGGRRGAARALQFVFQGSITRDVHERRPAQGDPLLEGGGDEQGDYAGRRHDAVRQRVDDQPGAQPD